MVINGSSLFVSSFYFSVKQKAKSSHERGGGKAGCGFEERGGVK